MGATHTGQSGGSDVSIRNTLGSRASYCASVGDGGAVGHGGAHAAREAASARCSSSSSVSESMWSSFKMEDPNRSTNPGRV